MELDKIKWDGIRWNRVELIDWNILEAGRLD